MTIKVKNFVILSMIQNKGDRYQRVEMLCVDQRQSPHQRTGCQRQHLMKITWLTVVGIDSPMIGFKLKIA